MRLIDADSLVKRMKNTWDMQDLYLPVHFEDLVEEEPTVGGWISVKDRLPPAGKVLLVARKYKEPGKKEIRYVETGELMDDCTWVSDSDEYKFNRKYHSQPYAWMSLPEAPKEEEND